MARPSESTDSPARASGTRRRMLEAAFELLHAQGVHGTSVDQVLEASGTGKSQLYHYFGSKEGLVQAVVEDFEQRLLAGELPGTGEIEDLAGLEAWFNAFVDFQCRTGSTRSCPMATIAAGLGPEQEPIRVIIERVFDHARGVLDRYFERCAERGQLAREVDRAGLAEFCIVVMQGGLVLSRVRRDHAPFARAVEQAMAHVRGLIDETA